MHKALVDTTILVDALLKTKEISDNAKAALGVYTTTTLPEYAIKEMKAGPLNYFVWLHNKLIQTNSIPNTILAIKDMRMRSNWMATASEALSAALEEGNNSMCRFFKATPALKAKYGEKADPTSVQLDGAKLYLKKKIKQAWKKKRELTTKVKFELNCLPDLPLLENNLGMIDNKPLGCKKGEECCLFKHMNEDLTAVGKMKSAIESSPKNENKKRSKALREVIKIKKSSEFPHKYCRNIGDAAFAYYCQSDEVILTTNIVDHKLLAEALGKRVRPPHTISPLAFLYNQAIEDRAVPMESYTLKVHLSLR